MNIVLSRKHRVMLATCYAAGMRVCEAVALTLPAIDSQRMVLRVEQGKGLKSSLPFITTDAHVLRICKLNSRTEIRTEVIRRGSFRG
jgi:site-specific recombinase XerD